MWKRWSIYTPQRLSEIHITIPCIDEVSHWNAIQDEGTKDLERSSDPGKGLTTTETPSSPLMDFTLTKKENQSRILLKKYNNNNNNNNGTRTTVQISPPDTNPPTLFTLLLILCRRTTTSTSDVCDASDARCQWKITPISLNRWGIPHNTMESREMYRE